MGPQLKLILFISVFIVLNIDSSDPGKKLAKERQYLPPKKGIQASIYTINSFQFGSFFPGASGGTVNISYSGIRSATGSVILIPTNEPISAASFEIHAPGNTMMQINYHNHVVLHGSNGGNMKLYPGPLSNGNPFITPPNAENGFIISMGGYLDVGDLTHNRPGQYTGSFQVTLIAE